MGWSDWSNGIRWMVVAFVFSFVNFVLTLIYISNVSGFEWSLAFLLFSIVSILFLPVVGFVGGRIFDKLSWPIWLKGGVIFSVGYLVYSYLKYAHIRIISQEYAILFDIIFFAFLSYPDWTFPFFQSLEVGGGFDNQHLLNFFGLKFLSLFALGALLLSSIYSETWGWIKRGLFGGLAFAQMIIFILLASPYYAPGMYIVGIFFVQCMLVVSCDGQFIPCEPIACTNLTPFIILIEVLLIGLFVSFVVFKFKNLKC